LTDRLAREAGITPEEIAALTGYRDNEFFTEQEKNVLSYVEAMCTTPVRVSDDLYKRLAKQLSSEQMVELTAAIALEGYVSNCVQKLWEGFLKKWSWCRL
jgi:alkylhydroperoxidase family enzyme